MKTFKCLLALLCALSINANSKGQEVNRTLGVGLQSSFPIYGLSVKYALTGQSLVQATIAPFGIKSDGGSASINFYGLRYIHSFPSNDENKFVIDPYLFVGGGLISYKYDYSSYGGSASSQQLFSYSLGGGLELIALKRIGISAELGYGKISLAKGTGFNSILAGGGLHYYIF